MKNKQYLEHRKELRKLKIKQGLCAYGACKNPATHGKLCQECRNKNLKINHESKKSLKIECFKAYGGTFCSCCGESELWVLCLDHVNNDGHEERKRLSNTGGYKFYQHLKALGYPDKDRYRVLCANCNFSIYANGICHHKRSGHGS